MAITRPLAYIEIHIKLRHTSLVAIWLVSIVFCSLPVLTSYFEQEECYDIAIRTIIHGLHTIPVLGIFLMYIRLACKITNHKRISIADGKNLIANKENNRLIRRVVISLFLCYLPYISMWEYTYAVTSNRHPCLLNKLEV